MRARDELLEKLADALAIGLEARILAGGLVAEVEVQVDRLFQPLQDPIGPGRDRVEMVLGEIEPRAAQQVARQHRQANEQDREQHEAADSK